MYKPSGKGWQKEASKKFKQAREHYIMHVESKKFWNDMGYGVSIWNEYSKDNNNDRYCRTGKYRQIYYLAME